MAMKAEHIQGWFKPDDEDAHPEHPIVIPPPGNSGAHPEHPIFYPPYPAHPIVIPPLVGIWPSPGHPAHPIVLPPEQLPPNSGPIYIEGSDDKPITTNPGTLQPALPPGTLPPSKVAVLVEVVGVEGQRWLTVDNTPTVNPLK